MFCIFTETKSQKKHSGILNLILLLFLFVLLRFKYSNVVSYVIEKDSSFLRIGSLNVRVKRTTEAVSNFLGVSQSNLDKAHKTWGSADSIPVQNIYTLYCFFFFLYVTFNKCIVDDN